MPYIENEARSRLGRQLVGAVHPMTKGELTYVAYTAAKAFLLYTENNYQVISDAIAALTDAAHELRRRVLDPYEDEKIKENGDIY